MPTVMIVLNIVFAAFVVPRDRRHSSVRAS